jgi:hypothetical protein
LGVLATPCSDLERDCRSLCANPEDRRALASYLYGNPVIQESVGTLLASFAITANARWEDVPAIQRPLVRAGSRLARWLPTFLIIDGPLGRVLREADSPLNEILRRRPRSYPALAQVRDLFNNDFFRLVRNGFGHWSLLYPIHVSDTLAESVHNDDLGAIGTDGTIEVLGTSESEAAVSLQSRRVVLAPQHNAAAAAGVNRSRDRSGSWHDQYRAVHVLVE